MKCEDCIHYELCSEGDEHIWGNPYKNEVEKVCNTFKNKSLFVELPCKVGGAIYLIFKEQWSVGKKETHWYIRKTKLTYGNMERVIKEYGEFVFLTREEAEAKLKELQNG